MTDEIEVEVVYVEPGQEFARTLLISNGATVRDVIAQSGLSAAFPTLDITDNNVGIYARRVNLDTVVTAGDRVEIYRPLTIDPMQARRQRAQKSKS